MFKRDSIKLLIKITCLFWSLLLIYVCLKPISGNISLFNHADKVFHFLSYLIWGHLFYLSFKKFKLSLIIGFFLGLIIEILQPTISNRSFEFFDLIANASGLLILFLTHKKLDLKIKRLNL